MIKMPCLFVRNFHRTEGNTTDRFTLTQIVNPGCEWVLDGEGTASRKRDGTACAFLQSVDPVLGVRTAGLFKRYDAKQHRETGLYKVPPAGSFPCSEPDPVTGHWPHWAPVTPQDKWHCEALARQFASLVVGATYELCGPKLQGNPEKLTEHTLIRHGSEECSPRRSFDGIMDYLFLREWEGIVFAHPDGRFAKIRRADYGLNWPVR